MSRHLADPTVVVNWLDSDVAQLITDRTLIEKENIIVSQTQASQSTLKRRKSVKVKQNENQSACALAEAINTNASNTAIDYSVQNQFLKETNHFELAATAQCKTSNNKLEQSHRINYNEMFEILKKYKYKYSENIDKLCENYEYYFEKWSKQMKFGFNVLVHGVGSKKKLLEKFAQTNLKNDYYLELIGYHPNLNLKNLFRNIILDILEISEIPKTFDEQIDVIRKNLSVPLYIVIHNIDGVCLRDSDVQYRLSELATIKNVHYIATIDHINSALLWDNLQFISFKWIYYEMNTFKSYDDEIMFENSLMLNQTGNMQLSSLIHVLKSLTQNAKSIFLIMAEHVLCPENTKKNVPFSKLYYECREKFIVSNELTLRAQLTEFIDHKLIKLKTEADGSEAIHLIVDDNNLKLYIDELKDKI